MILKLHNQTYCTETIADHSFKSLLNSQLTVMSTVWMSVSISFTAVHSYVPALCLVIDGISRYSSSEARSPVTDHTHKVGQNDEGHSVLMGQGHSCGLHCQFHTQCPCVTCEKAPTHWRRHTQNDTLETKDMLRLMQMSGNLLLEGCIIINMQSYHWCYTEHLIAL